MNYIVHSACRGTAPSQFSEVQYFSRNALLATLMRNREIPRYILAPFGFGKSLLACSYASLVNNFEHTFWLDGENPCFLRDLDAQSLLPDLLDETSVGDLVVFDEIPHLGATRREHLWQTCRNLARAGREVLVCARPASNPLRGHEQACVCLGAQDLLYSENDFELLRSSGIYLRQDISPLHPVGRIPYLASCLQDNFESFLRAHIAEMDNTHESALSFALLLLERGTFEELSILLDQEISADQIDTGRLRPFVQINKSHEEFEALGFPFNCVLRAFAPFMANIAHVMGADSVSEVAMHCANVLLERNNAQRARQLLVALCEPHGRSTWLQQHQDTMLHSCALAAAESIYDSLRNDKWRSIPALYTGARIRRCLLAPTEENIESVANTASKVDFPLPERLHAATYAYLHLEDAQQASELEVAFQGQKTSLKKEIAALEGPNRNLWAFWQHVCQHGFKESLDPAIVADETSFLHNNAALAVACYLHKIRLEQGNVDQYAQLLEAVQLCFKHACNYAFMVHLAALHREVEALGLQEKIDIQSYAMVTQWCNAFKDQLEVQRGLYMQSKAVQASALSLALRAQATQTSLRAHVATNAIPLLSVQLFGKFEVRIGETRIDSADFRRKKVRTLLTLLVVENGHDLSCDNLSERLWADSPQVHARHNFYNCVSMLRKNLSLQDGSCPYLRRPHGIVGLNSKYVQSDVASVKALCDQLRTFEPDPNGYYHILEQIRELYKGDLLPYENDEAMIIAAREEQRNRVVNALMHASNRLAVIGESSVALQMLEQALVYNPQREDCYERLMSLQARSGQRPAAIRTWMRYRSFLDDELGLDPSLHMHNLYRRIISENK